MIRVVVVDDNAVVRRGLIRLLEDADDIEVAGEACTGEQAIALAGERDPDVVLMDIRMPVLDGVSAAERLGDACRVLMLTYAEGEEHVRRAVDAGAAGYLIHGQFEPAELAAAIRRVAGGGSVASPSAIDGMFATLQASSSVSTGPPADPEVATLLTDRQREVMELVAAGRSNAEIAAELCLAEKSVKNYLTRVYRRLGVSSRSQAMARWLGLDRS